LAKGDRSINKYGNESQVDPGYISRLLRGLVDNAPSAAIIKKLADAAWNGVSVHELLSSAGYLDHLHFDKNNYYGDLPKAKTSEQWDRVIEEAVRYNISPEEAFDFISSLGRSIDRVRKKI
jgi:hypothetical protein